MYYIYDNYHEEWYSVAFADFEMAEEEMETLIEYRKQHNAPYDFDIYQKITQSNKPVQNDINQRKKQGAGKNPDFFFYCIKAIF